MPFLKLKRGTTICGISLFVSSNSVSVSRQLLFSHGLVFVQEFERAKVLQNFSTHTRTHTRASRSLFNQKPPLRDRAKGNKLSSCFAGRCSHSPSSVASRRGGGEKHKHAHAHVRARARFDKLKTPVLFSCRVLFLLTTEPLVLFL